MLLSSALALLASGTLSPSDPALLAPVEGEQPRSVYVTAYAPQASRFSGDYMAAQSDGTYFQVGFGLLTTEESSGPDEEIDFDEGFAVPFALGRHYTSGKNSRLGFDLELEGLFTDQDTDDPNGTINAVSDITVLGLLFNGAVDFSLTRSFSIYGGGGLGAAMLDIGTESDSINDFNDEDGPFLAWQLKAGLRWWANENISWNLGYRFLNIDDAEIDDDLGAADFDLETQQHVIELGVRFQL